MKINAVGCPKSIHLRHEMHLLVLTQPQRKALSRFTQNTDTKAVVRSIKRECNE